MEAIGYAKKISIVMPAYNAGKTIDRAINSVLNQDFQDWELIITDDGSSDNTLAIITEYSNKDKRIRIFSIENSGSAKYPRDYAIYNACSDYILYLDADDYLGENYLDIIWNSHIKTGADLVLAKMAVFDEVTKSPMWFIPAKPYDKAIYKGLDLVKDTLNGWKIGFNGALISKRLLDDTMSYPKNDKPIWMNSDEYDSRAILCKSPNVFFVDAIYHYSYCKESISNNVNIKQFHRLCTNYDLHVLVSNHFSKDSEEYKLINRHCLLSLADSLTLYYSYNCILSNDERIWVSKKSSELFDIIDFQSVSYIYRFIYSNFKVLRCLMHIKAILKKSSAYKLYILLKHANNVK